MHLPRTGNGEGICLPSICSSGQMPQETIRPECPGSSTDSTSLAIPLVVQLLKGAYNLRPLLPRYSSMWDVGAVLSFIESKGTNNNLTLKDLSQKLGMLLALTAIERVSEVIAHDLRYRHYSQDGVMFHLPELTKKSKVGSTLKSSFHASFPSNPKLCVIECLREYEKRTLGFRPKDPSMPNRLLLSHIKPHKPISFAILGR